MDNKLIDILDKAMEGNDDKSNFVVGSVMALITFVVGKEMKAD